MLVAIKGMRNYLEIDSSAKKELHLLRELDHENINRFVGACIDPPDAYIVTQYCTHGSLEVNVTSSQPPHRSDSMLILIVPHCRTFWL